VLCHLKGDKVFYHEPYCVDFERLREDFLREVGEIDKWDEDRWASSRTSKVYYNDYNLINRRVEERYGVLERVRKILSAPLLGEILAGFGVRFPDDGAEPVYMNLENIRRCVELVRGDRRAGL